MGEVLDQRAFYNACLRVETRLKPERLLDACKAVERAFGRVQAGEDGYVKHGPRAIDVDVLLLGDAEYSVRAAHAAAPRGDVAALRARAAARARPAPGGARARAARPTRWRAIEGQDVHRAGPPLEVGP